MALTGGVLGRRPNKAETHKGAPEMSSHAKALPAPSDWYEPLAASPRLLRNDCLIAVCADDNRNVLSDSQQVQTR